MIAANYAGDSPGSPRQRSKAHLLHGPQAARQRPRGRTDHKPPEPPRMSWMAPASARLPIPSCGTPTTRSLHARPSTWSPSKLPMVSEDPNRSFASAASFGSALRPRFDSALQAMAGDPLSLLADILGRELACGESAKRLRNAFFARRSRYTQVPVRLREPNHRRRSVDRRYR